MRRIAPWPKWGGLLGQFLASLFWVLAVVTHDDYKADMVFQLLAASSWMVACGFQAYVLLGYMAEAQAKRDAANAAVAQPLAAAAAAASGGGGRRLTFTL